MALADWISLSSTSGNSGVSTITITAATNEQLIERLTSFTVKTNIQQLTQIVNLRQNNHYLKLYVLFDGDWVEITNSSGDYDFTFLGEDTDCERLFKIETNVDSWNGEVFNALLTINGVDIEDPSGGSWLTFSPSTGGSGTTLIDACYDENISTLVYPDSRSVDVRFYSDEFVKPINSVITITQQGKYDRLTVNPAELVSGYMGGTQRILVSCQRDWEIVSYPDWVSLNITSGFGSQFVIVTVPSWVGDTRTGSIVFRALRGEPGTTVTVPITQYDYTEYYGHIPLTLQILSDGDIKWYCGDRWCCKCGEWVYEYFPETIQVSNDGGITWTELTSSTGGTPYAVNFGDTIMVKGNRDSSNLRIFSWFGGTAQYNVYGNINSLIYGDNYENPTITHTPELEGLFRESTGLTSAQYLVIPDSSYCAQMFRDCINLTTAPEVLPATDLVNYCYNSMFDGCTSLVNAPKLPAIILAEHCYEYMFDGCSSLVNAPVLPATTLKTDCYKYMFYGCTSLRYVKCLAKGEFSADVADAQYTESWFSYASPVGTFVKRYDSIWYRSVHSIRTGWDEENVLVVSEYDTTDQDFHMDYNSPQINVDVVTYNEWTIASIPSWLSASVTNNSFTITPQTNTGSTRTGTISININNTIKNIYVTQHSEDELPIGELFTIEVISGGTISWVFDNTIGVREVTLTYSIDNGNWYDLYPTTGGTEINVNAGDIVRFKGTKPTFHHTLRGTATVNIYGNIMSLLYWDYNLYDKTTLVNNAFRGLFGSSSPNRNLKIVDASNLILPATTLTQYCYAYMFYNLPSLERVPKLPATTLANSCYADMFSGCTSLVNAPELPAETLVNECYYNMFFGCSSLNYIKCLAISKSAYLCTNNWVKGVSPTGTFVKSSTTSWSTGDSGIPDGWTIQDA